MKPEAATQRAREIQLIHVARRELKLDEDAYRDLMETVTGRRSSKDLNDRQRHRFIEHLKKIGFTPKRAAPQDDHDSRQTKARALWHALALAGQIGHDTDDTFNAYVKRQVGADHWRFLNDHQRTTVIESLKRWARRCDIEV
jgi:phage gp16-like protein